MAATKKSTSGKGTHAASGKAAKPGSAKASSAKAAKTSSHKPLTTQATKKKSAAQASHAAKSSTVAQEAIKQHGLHGPSTPASTFPEFRMPTGYTQRSVADIRAEEAGRRVPSRAGSHIVGVETRSAEELGKQIDDRREKIRKDYRRLISNVIILVGVAVGLAAGALCLYFSQAFEITDIRVEGIEHLTADEINALVNVPVGSTLLRVNVDNIEKSLQRTSWIESVTVRREFPSTLVIVAKERAAAAIAEIPSADAMYYEMWMIASDGMWLMPVPNEDSEFGQSIAPIIYEEVESLLHITSIPYGATAEIGTICTNDNINNALGIVSSLSTSLTEMIVEVNANDSQSTIFTLDSGVQVAFGLAEDVREKEQVVLALLTQYSGQLSYINVRVVDKPTYRTI